MKDQESNTWENFQNTEFYNSLGVEGLELTSNNAGMSKCPDLDIIYDQIKYAKRLLNVGSGYGRVEAYLLSKGFRGKIDSVEKSKALFEGLKEKYSPRVRCFNEDILTYQNQIKYDVVLCMFSVLTDFPQSQQFDLVKKLEELLGKDKPALIAIDSFPPGKTPLNCETSDQKNYTALYNGKVLRGYLPETSEIEAFAFKLGLTTRVVPYKTATQRDRVLYLLSR